ncbi:hypothetical protein [Thiobacillus sp.]
MKLNKHLVCVLLQFLAACAGGLFLLMLWEVYIWVQHGYGGFPPAISDKEILILPLLLLEGLTLGAIPSYALLFKLRKSNGYSLRALNILLVGFIQGMLFIPVAFFVIWIGFYWWLVDEIGSNTFWLFMAFLLASAAFLSSFISALILRNKWTDDSSPRREKSEPR